jgi:uncharacterized protein
MPDQLPEIELEDRGSKGRYVLRGAGGAEAEMTFTKIGEHQLIIDHTEVPPFAARAPGFGSSPVPSRTREQQARRSSRSARSPTPSSAVTRNGRMC